MTLPSTATASATKAVPGDVHMLWSQCFVSQERHQLYPLWNWLLSKRPAAELNARCLLHASAGLKGLKQVMRR